MKDVFAELFKPNAQGYTNAFGSNPDTISLAGLLQMQGVLPEQAMMQAAKMNREREVANIEKTKFAQMQQKALMEQEQQRQRMLALQQLGQVASPEEMNQLLFSGAFEPSEINNLSGLLNPKAEENVVFNPVTGEALLKQKQGGRITGFTPIQGNAGGGVFAQTAASNMPYETPVEAKERRAQESEYFKQLRDEVKSTNEAAASLRSVEDSLQKVTTGIFSGTKKNIGSFGKEFLGSELGTGASDLANIDAASVNLLQPFVSATKGAVSDREMALFQSAVPNSTQLPETNRKIIQAMKLSINRKKEKLKAAEAWRKEGKNLNEFEASWAEYIEANPVIAQDKVGNIQINPSNVNNWKNKLGKDSNLGSQSSTKQEKRSIQSLSMEELEALARGQ